MSAPRRAPKGSISSHGIPTGTVIPIRFSAPLVYRLRAAATREGYSVAEWVRRAVEAVLGA